MKTVLTEKQILVKQAIECLTNDEDRRQDLWVAYLSGSSFQEYLTRLNLQDDIYYRSKTQADQLMFHPISDNVLLNLSEIECEILYLLMVGYDVDAVSRYNGIDKVRIHQTLISLRESNLLKSMR